MTSTVLPQLAAGPDAFGGCGMFATDYITSGSVVTFYTGPERFPKYEKVSRTHSLHIIGDVNVPLEQREYRVIDGEWAKYAVVTPTTTTPLDEEMSSMMGSMINSSYDCKSRENVHSYTKDQDFTDPRFACTLCDGELLRARVGCDSGCADELYTRGRRFVQTAIVASRNIEAGEELFWSYPFQRQATQ